MSESPSPTLYKCELCGVEGLDKTELYAHVNIEHLDFLTPENEMMDYVDDDDLRLSGDELRTPNGWSETNTSKVIRNTKYYNGVLNNDAGCSNGYIPNNINLRRKIENSDLYTEANGTYRDTALNKKSSGKQGSPLRSQLALKLNVNSPSRTSISPLKQCLMCEFTSNDPRELEEHINRLHFDPTSPSLVQTNANPTSHNGYENPTFNMTNPRLAETKHNVAQCPLCTKSFDTATEAEMHINVEHKDILSPEKLDNKASTSSNGTVTNDIIMMCPVCNLKLPDYTQEQLTIHIDNHFDESSTMNDEEQKMERKRREQEEFEMLKAQYGMEEEEASFSSQASAGMRKAVYNGSLSVASYYQRSVELKKAHSVGVDDGSSATKGIIEKIQSINASDSNVVQQYLCSAVDHYATTYADRGWGCGYRNIQMLISSLLHEKVYSGNLNNCVPSIPALQRLIETAWSMGFDVQGSEQLAGKVYNTRKWIGACEVVTLFSSLRIRCHLIDFYKPTGADGGHPALFDWVLRYFQKNPEQFKPPLYLQHQGHSRTVIGYERHKDGKIYLLVLDPSHTPHQIRQLFNTASCNCAMRLIRCCSSALRAKQYQLVSVTGLINNDNEFESSKVLQSIRIPQGR